MIKEAILWQQQQQQTLSTSLQLRKVSTLMFNDKDSPQIPQVRAAAGRRACDMMQATLKAASGKPGSLRRIFSCSCGYLRRLLPQASVNQRSPPVRDSPSPRNAAVLSRDANAPHHRPLSPVMM